jgi:hypothetical protein
VAVPSELSAFVLALTPSRECLLQAAGYQLPHKGMLFIASRDRDSLSKPHAAVVSIL